MCDLSLQQVVFSKLKGITPDLASKLLDVFGDEAEFFRMSESELRAASEMESKCFSASYRESLLFEAEKELDFIEKKNIRCLYFNKPNYPARFQNIPDAPILLYAKGDIDLNKKKIVGVVGTRRITQYGQKLTNKFIEELTEAIGNDVIVVSGLAYGVDVSAHKAALNARIPTVGVVAHGLDMIYPTQHRNIAAEMIHEGGAVVTEYGHGTRIHRSNFLARNRIIAALSDCVIVIESAEKGGALVTAKIAQSYGRDVFAFPGRVSDEFSAGCNNLINKNIAALISSASDVVDMMRWEKQTKPIEKSLFVEYTPEEQKIIGFIKEKDGIQINLLSALSQIPVHKLMSILFELEFKGAIVVMPGNRYCLA